MNRTGYLAIPPFDVYDYLKQFVYKRRLPSNLTAPRTVLFDCQHRIANVRSFNDQIYVLYSNVVHNLHTGVCETYARNVVDFTVVYGAVNIVVDDFRDIDFQYWNVVRTNCDAMLGTENGYLYVREDSVISAYVVPYPVTDDALRRCFTNPVLTLKDTIVKKIVHYDEHHLLFVCCDAILKLVNKSDGSVYHEFFVHYLVNDAVVDDEKKMFLVHQDMFSIWDSELRCVKTGALDGFVDKICLHNHSLLLTSFLGNKVLVLE